MKKLNLGSGSDIKEDWTNLDRAAQPGVDVVHNIENLPLPFKDNTFDEIMCQDILEHVDYMPVLKDLHRILVPGGKIHIRVPHYTSRNNYTDPTHKKRFSVSTFDYFAKGTHVWNKDRGEFFFEFAFESILSRHLNFDKTSSRLLFYNYLIEWLFNLTPRQQVFYELTGLSWLFPAADIRVTLVK